MIPPNFIPTIIYSYWKFFWQGQVIIKPTLAKDLWVLFEPEQFLTGPTQEHLRRGKTSSRELWEGRDDDHGHVRGLRVRDHHPLFYQY